ncbi:acetyltransferase [Moraxella osloensis]|uniref:Acetyltransferase n=1 Tax=Faucicola osloensis TaxID=34062 RepID=A0AAW6THT6_FAUOS|nr:acetyltransferase [Moraxella osloensis]MDI4509534.1 acetyltransferase [Moraxella osloensis]
MNKVYAVYGASGCGRSLMPIARECISTSETIYFIDDGLITEQQINGYKAVNYDMFKSIESIEKYVLIAIANSNIRQKIAEKIINDDIKLWTVQSHSTVIMDEVMIGAGAALSPFVTIGANVKIGKCFHANLYSYIEHDCVIGDYVTFAPRVSCNGNVHIHDHAYIGTGAVIRQGTPDKPLIIGKGAVVGMGAVVTKDVPAGVTVVGNAAKVLVK